MNATPECLLLSRQLCFPLYAASKAVVRQYGPLLAPYRLTYTQYVTLLALYEHGAVCVAELGQMLYLDSGTLSPLLQKLEKQGYIEKKKAKDARYAVVSLTQEGLDLREKLSQIPAEMGKCVRLEPDEAAALYRACEKILGGLEK